MSVTCSICSTTNPDILNRQDPQYCEGCGVELTSQTSDLEGTGSEAASAKPSASSVSSPPPSEVPSEEASDSIPPKAPSPGGEPEKSITAETEPQIDALDDGGTPDAVQDPSSEPVLEPEPISEPEPEPEVVPKLESASAEAAPTDATANSAEPAPISTANSSTAPAYLLVKRHGAVTSERVPLQGERLTVGRFDPSTGPVDIDVTDLPGAEHISRRHAEIYAEAGVWNVRDLGSTNGVFLKPAGEASYSPRLQEPAELADGDELAFGNVIFVFRQE